MAERWISGRRMGQWSLGLLLSLLGLWLFATAPTAAAAGYTLDQCIEKALKYSPEVREAKQEVEMSKAKHDEAAAHKLPTIEGLGLVGPAHRARGDQVYSPDTSTHINQWTIFGRISAAIVQPIYTFGKIQFRQDAAKAGIEVSRAGVQRKEGETILQVKEAYYGLLLGRVGKETVDEVKGFLNNARDILQRLLAVRSKSVSEIDQYKLEAYAGELEKYRNLTEKAESLAYDALRTRMGLKSEERLEIQEQSLPMPEKPLQSLGHYVTTAQELRPEFKQLKAGLTAKQKLVDAARADQYPSFFVGGFGSLAGAPGRTRIKNPFIYDDFNHVYGGAAGGMKFDLDFGIKKAKIREAKADLQKLRETNDYAQDNIPLQVQKAYLEAREAEKNIQAFRKAYTESRKWMVAALSNYDMGLAPSKEVFDAIEKYALNRGEFLKAIYDYNISLAQLNLYTGSYLREKVYYKE
ncbi:TolC family protein [Desulfobacca acetoxidans]|uniref:Outer membrane efflux protein n=1 Tax=Desulfobacca acetoxidans (strain ATCC 700848 / DSM 11109 / ASRB2) TaxID=880072 RepID=F2NCT1_DESAR|nr:TolC family protein [Desulfobacca acetoxidans]AEB09362.1 outer membrane efflux protein [Desulfobacca acetoxidans DSM 11109]